MTEEVFINYHSPRWRRFLKRILDPLLGLLWRIAPKESVYSFDGIRLKIFQSVFHPAYFLSTHILIKYLKTRDLNGKKLLELGAGSGLISFWAARQGAIVTASDINTVALEGLRFNADFNKITINIVHSDLFQNINNKAFFDYIIINPPYYPQKPKNDAERAFFCGEQFEYFHQLFKNIAAFLYPNNKVIMILSEDCDLKKILEIAQLYKITLNFELSIQKLLEKNHIFEIHNFVN